MSDTDVRPTQSQLLLDSDSMVSKSQMTSPLSAWSTHYDMIKPKYVKRNGSPLLDALTHSTTKLSAVPDAIIGYLDPKVCATHDTCRTASYYRA
mgnify:FL=1